MAKRVAGTTYIKMDGEQLEVSGGVECPMSDTKRETVMGLNGSAGYKETAQEPYTKLSAIFMPSFPIDKIRTATDMTVTTEMPNGRVYTLSGAFLKGETTVKADDGTVDLEFGGTRGIWS